MHSGRHSGRHADHTMDLSHAQVCAGSVRSDPRALARSRLRVKALYCSSVHVTEMDILDLSNGRDGGIKRGTERGGGRQKETENGEVGMQYRVKYKMSASFLTLKGNIGHVPLEEGKLSVSVISQCSEVTRNQRSE